MKRGDVVTVAVGGGFGGKPRPALIIQSDRLISLQTIVVALITSDEDGGSSFRPRLEPDGVNGLVKPSHLMVDILVTARADQVGKIIGHLTREDMARAERALLVILGFAE